MTMEHMLNSTDVATFRYNGDDYTATMGHNSSPSNLITYLEDATLNSDNNITFGSGLLSVTVEASSDKTSTSVTVTTKASTATLSNVSYIANSHYWHIADIPLNTTTYNDDMLGSRGAEDYSGKGKFIPPGTGTSETTLWMAGTDPARPLSAPNFSGVTSVLADSEEDRSYVYTYANFMGEEGPPSNPSDIVTVQNGGTVFVTFEDDVDYNYNLHGGGSSIKEVAWSSTVADPTDPTDPVIVTTPIEGGGEHVDLTLTEGLSFNSTLSAKADTPDNPAFRLLYRTSSGTTGVEFQLVAALDINDLVFEDTVANTKLGESLRSTGWRPPPEDLKGLKVLPNGFLAGFSGRSLGFSEAYMPHAWPQGYEIKFSEHIVGLGVTGNSLVVLTQGFPYLVTGDSPDSMSAVRVESAQACASRYSIVDMGDSVVYASPDGLVSVGESGTDVLTQDMLTRAQWQEYGPDDMVGFLYEGYYIGSSIAAGKSFIMSADGKLSTLSGVFKTSYQDYEQDRLYVLDDGGLKIFNEGPRRKVTWLSKEFRFQSPTNLGVLKVLGNGNCLVRIRGDGNLLDINPDASVKTELVVGGGGDIVRLPGGNAYLEYQIELSTFGSVETVTLASSVGELTSA